MSFWFDDDETHLDPFGFDERSMVRKAVNAVRGIYGVTGAVALIGGLALLFWPVKTLVVLTVILGIYFLIAGAVHLVAAVGVPLLPSGWRALSVLTSLLLLAGGVIMLRNQTASAAVLTTFVVLATGLGWIIEGVMTLLESGLVHNRGLAVFSGILSIAAGVIVFAWPMESTGMLVIFAGALLTVFGIMLIARAVSFGKVA